MNRKDNLSQVLPYINLQSSNSSFNQNPKKCFVIRAYLFPAIPSDLKDYRRCDIYYYMVKTQSTFKCSVFSASARWHMKKIIISLITNRIFFNRDNESYSLI